MPAENVYSYEKLIEAYAKLGLPVPEELIRKHEEASKKLDASHGSRTVTMGPATERQLKDDIKPMPEKPGVFATFSERKRYKELKRTAEESRVPSGGPTIGPLNRDFIESGAEPLQRGPDRSGAPSGLSAGGAQTLHSIKGGFRKGLAQTGVKIAGLMEKADNYGIGAQSLEDYRETDEWGRPTPAGLAFSMRFGMDEDAMRQAGRDQRGAVQELRDQSARGYRAGEKEAKERGLEGTLGTVASGFGGALEALPRLWVMGPHGLIIDSAVGAYAMSNPDTEVELWEGGPVVKGEFLPTVIGAVQGGMAHGIFKAAGMLPPPFARPAAGAGMGALTAAQGGSLEEIAEQVSVGAVLSGKGRGERLLKRTPREVLAEMRKPASERQWKPIMGEVVPEPPPSPLITDVSAERNWDKRTTLGYLEGKPVFKYRRRDGTEDYEVGMGDEAWPATPEQRARIQSTMDRPMVKDVDKGVFDLMDSQDARVVRQLAAEERGYEPGKPVPENEPGNVKDSDLPPWIGKIERLDPKHKFITTDAEGEGALDYIGWTPRVQARWSLFKLRDVNGKPSVQYAKNGDTVLKQIAEKYTETTEAYRLLQAGDIDGYVKEVQAQVGRGAGPEQIFGDLSRWLLTVPQVRNTPVRILNNPDWSASGVGGRYSPSTGEVFMRHAHNSDPVGVFLHEMVHRAQLAYEGRTDNNWRGHNLASAFETLKSVIKSREPFVPAEVTAGTGDMGYGFKNQVEGAAESFAEPRFVKAGMDFATPRTIADLVKTAKDLIDAKRDPSKIPFVQVVPVPHKQGYYYVQSGAGTYIGEMKAPAHVETMPLPERHAAMRQIAGQDLFRTMYAVSPDTAVLPELVRRAQEFMEKHGIIGVKTQGTPPPAGESVADVAFAKDPKKKVQTKAVAVGTTKGMPKKPIEEVLAKRVPDFKEKLTFDPSTLEAKDVTLGKFQEIERWRQSPEFTAFWGDVYKNAHPLKSAGDILEFKEPGKGKIGGLMILKLTRNCQRANLVNLGIKWGLIPPEFAGRGCWDACWVDRKAQAAGRNEWSKGYEKISERLFMAADPKAIDAAFKSPVMLAKMKASPFLRHGQDGCDSHTIYMGLMERWLAAQKAAGIKKHNVLITAGYAPNTVDHYRALAPYRDMFTMHVSTGGWLPKGEILFRLNEFRKAQEAGLDVRFRIVTNKDQLTSALNLAEEVNAKPVDFSNHEFLMDVLAQNFGINTPDARRFYILETPYHNDLMMWKGKKRSDPSIADASECCRPPKPGEPATCVKCVFKCFSKGGRFLGDVNIPEGMRVEDASKLIGDFRNEMESRDIPDPVPSVDFVDKGGSTKESDLQKELRSWGKGERDIVKATSRASGAVGENAVVPKYVTANSVPGDRILDFGAGKDASHAQRLRKSGLDVTAYDEWNLPGIHDPDALSRKYNTVYASNVINVQPSPEALATTFRQMVDAVEPGGRLVFNLPASPRKGAWEGLTTKDATREIVKALEAEFDTVAVTGAKEAPVFVATGKLEASEPPPAPTVGDVEFKRKLDRPVPEAPGVDLRPKDRAEVRDPRYATVPPKTGVVGETKESLAAKGIVLKAVTRRGADTPVKDIGEKWSEDVPRIGPPPDQTSMVPEPVLRFVMDLADVPLHERGGKGGKGFNVGGLHKYTDIFEHPIRFFERVGGGLRNPLKDFFLSDYKRLNDTVVKSTDSKVNELEDVFRANGVKPNIEASKRIGNILIGRQRHGKKILEKMGETPIKDAELTTADRAIVKFIDENLLQMFHEINAARVKSGQEPVEFRQDYFTFLRLTKSFTEDGYNILTAPKKWLESKMKEIEDTAYDLKVAEKTPQEQAGKAKARKMRFPFADPRSEKMSPLDLDAIGVFSRYSDYAYRQIHMAEMLGQWEQVIDGKWEVDGKKWSLQDSDPGLRAALQGYRARVLAGSLGELPQAHRELIRKVGNNFAVSRVALNVTSVLSQFTSHAHSAAWLGPKYMALGLTDYAKAVGEWVKGKPDHMSFARRSGDIGARLKDPVVHDFMSSRAKTPLGEKASKARDRSLRLMQMADYTVAQVLWRGAYKKALDGKAPGYERGNQQDAVTYANESVSRVQSSIGRADKAPVQTTDLGMAFMVLQNFVMNEWGFLTRDVLRIGSVERTRDNVDRIVTYLLASAATSALYEEVAGIRSPMNAMLDLYQLGKAGKKGYEKGGVLGAASEVALEAGSGVPIVGGSTRFNVSPGTPIFDIYKTGADLVRKPTVAKGIDVASRIFGIPGGGQASKALKGETAQERVTGKKPEPLATEQKGKKKYKSLGGSRGSGKKQYKTLGGK